MVSVGAAAADGPGAVAAARRYLSASKPTSDWSKEEPKEDEDDGAIAPEPRVDALLVVLPGFLMVKTAPLDAGE